MIIWYSLINILPGYGPVRLGVSPHIYRAIRGESCDVLTKGETPIFIKTCTKGTPFFNNLCRRRCRSSHLNCTRSVGSSRSFLFRGNCGVEPFVRDFAALSRWFASKCFCQFYTLLSSPLRRNVAALSFN